MKKDYPITKFEQQLKRELEEENRKLELSKKAFKLNHKVYSVFFLVMFPAITFMLIKSYMINSEPGLLVLAICSGITTLLGLAAYVVNTLIYVEIKDKSPNEMKLETRLFLLDYKG